MLRARAVLLGCAAVLALASSVLADASVVVKDRGPGDVENGSAYDKGSFDLPGKKLAVPTGATVIQRGAEAKVQVFVKKTLAFGGHPPMPMTIRTARQNLGCAIKTDGDAMLLATYGEWTSKEGGAQVHLTVVVPAGVTVEKRDRLAGEDSLAHPAVDEKVRHKRAGYWYGPWAPGAGWKALLTAPDGERQADKAQ